MCGGRLRLLLSILLGALPCGPLIAAELTLRSPAEYQVFQRQTRETGQILVRGEAIGDTGRIEARVGDGDWIQLHFTSASGQFEGDLEAKAGGFYPVEARLLRAGKSVAAAIVPHVGVGEVFVVAGQSNATNYGEVRHVSKTVMVVAFSGENWRIADDPQPGVQDNSTKGSFIPAFGDALYEKFRLPIAVASVGHGSTSVRQWLPKGEPVAVQPTMTKYVIPLAGGGWESDGTLFNGMMKRIGQPGPHGFRAVLWHQGESDANQKPGHQIAGDEYYKMLAKLIGASRAAAGWNVPWFVAQVSYHTPNDTSSPEIREAQRRVWQAGLALEGPDTDQLGREYREKNGEGVHLNAAGLEAHGKLWAEKVSAWLK